MGTGKETSLHGLGASRGAGSEAAREERPASTPGSQDRTHLPLELQLELERLRVERDAMAAELQEERAERLRAEERLRLLEREKLEHMRQAAAAREKLASELEESRLKLMRAEARQAALEAEARLAEIGARRRAQYEAEETAPAERGGEIAEGVADAPPAAEDREDPGPSPAEQAAASHRPSTRRTFSVPSPPRRPARESPPQSPPSSARREEAGAARDRTGGGSSAGSAKPAGQRLSRFSDAAFSPPSAPSSRGESPRPPGGASHGGAAGARRVGPDRRSGAGGGDAPRKKTGREVDRGKVEAQLGAGARIRTTDRFAQFQPVAQAHIKVCDWLAQADSFAELQAKAAGELPDSTLLDVLVLLLERSFIELRQP